ncbi:MAG TPA: hypothetical protein VFE06_13025 [Acidobacteriaceae bacterium]|jgi:hypothetical protein|nr:hypothetical protein [Acidobacteriaceae bacterium]
MFRLGALALLGAGFIAQAPLHAQVTATAPEEENPQYAQRWDFYAGAQYAHFNPSPGRGVQAVNLLGWQGDATVWMRMHWGIEANARGEYGNLVVPANSDGVPSSPPMSEHLFLFGPNVRILMHSRYTFGMHALIGAAYGKFSDGFPSGVMPQALGIYNDKLALGLAVGPSVDYNLGPRLSVRLIPDWQPTNYGFPWQNEFAGSVGIVYKMGRLGK